MSPLDTLLVGGRVVRCTEASGLSPRDEAIGVREGKIAYIGTWDDAPPADSVRELNGDLVMPGLVDPHTHLVFAGSRSDEFARRMAGVDYRTIAAEGGGIASTVMATRAASDDDLFERARQRALALRAGGVTSVEVKSGYGLTTAQEVRCLSLGRRLHAEGIVRVTTTFLGAHTVPPERRDDRARYVAEVIEEQIPAVAEAGLADACDVYCDEGAFDLGEARRVLEAGRDAGMRVRAHVGQFADLGGAELAAELEATSADHLEAVSDAGLQALASAGTVAVFLPGAWRTLRQTPPDARRFRDAGVTIAVGTDLNPGTSPTSDLLLCAALGVRDAGLTTEEALLGVTRHAAKAAGFEGGVGRIELGGVADLAVFPVEGPHSLPYALGGIRASLVMLAGNIFEDSEPPRLW